MSLCRCRRGIGFCPLPRGRGPLGGSTVRAGEGIRLQALTQLCSLDVCDALSRKGRGRDDDRIESMLEPNGALGVEG